MDTMWTPPTNPPVDIIGQDGNAFAILGRCQKAAKNDGWEKEDIDKFMEIAMSGDYDDLLRAVVTHFTVDDPTLVDFYVDLYKNDDEDYDDPYENGPYGDF